MSSDTPGGRPAAPTSSGGQRKRPETPEEAAAYAAAAAAAAQIGAGVAPTSPTASVEERSGAVKSPADLAAGLFLLLFASFLLYGAWDLKIGQLRSIGAGLMPKTTATLLAAFGALLVVQSFITHGSTLQRWSLRGPVFVFGAILLFAATIRGSDLGLFKVPALGLVISGPLAVFISALADPQTRPKEAAIYAVLLTTACVIVFKFILRLPIPLAPWWLGY